MKIKFNQPKYVLPLIITPFILFGFFIVRGGKAKPKTATNNQPENGMNTNMPGVDTSIAKANITDKFDAYQQAFKNARDSTAMNEINRGLNDNGQLEYQSSYNAQDLAGQHKMDSLKDILSGSQEKIQKQLAAFNEHSSSFGNDNNAVTERTDNSSNPILKKLLALQQKQREAATMNSENSEMGGENSPPEAEPNSYQTQMKVFKEQMHYIDSVQKANGGTDAHNDPSRNNKGMGVLHKDFDPNKDSSFKPLPISSANKINGSLFNTLTNSSDDVNSISAMIDQDVQATLGSRVRIRLLKDMYAGDNLIKKGTYIYGVVTGFQKQRVNISIGQIMYQNTSLPVKMDVFDNDGYLGLYVPGSNFREFSKEIGTQGTQGLSQAITPDNSDVKMSMLSQIFNTTTTTLSNLIKKDKAFLKYNYIIYLKENKTEQNN